MQALREPRVVSVAAGTAHRFSKQVQPGIRLIAGEGVEGDAHRGATVQHLYQKRKNPALPNLSQVHLFAVEMLEELAAKGFALAPGDLGENILTEGLDLLELSRGTRLQLGPEAVVELTGLRTPCVQIDRFRAGLQRHLWGPRDANGQRTRRAGIMAVVLAGGIVTADDPIRAEPPAGPHQPLGPV